MSLSEEIRSSLSLPAFCAPMFHVNGPDLVREAAIAGVISGLPRANASSIEEFDQWLGAINRGLKDHADRHPGARIAPVAVNLSSRMARDEIPANLDVCRKHGVNLILNAMGNPAELVKMVHDWGGLIYHDVTNIRFAEKAADAGVDGLTCIGSGGGGHSGTMSHFALVPRIRQFFDGTVVLAGAVSNGAAIRAAEILGADLAYLGTRFIATRESLVPDAYKALLVSQRADALRYTDKITGVPANWLVDSFSLNGLDPDNLPAEPSRSYDHLPAEARPWKTIWSAGQGIELIDDVPTVAELVRRLRAEYVAACEIPDMVASARLNPIDASSSVPDAGARTL